MVGFWFFRENSVTFPSIQPTYFPSIHTTSFSSQLHPPRWLEQNFYFPHLNHPLYYRAPAGVSPIFRATLPTSTELISWTEKSEYQNVLFFESLIHSNQQKKLFGTGYGRSSGRKTIQFFLVSKISEDRLPPTWRA